MCVMERGSDMSAVCSYILLLFFPILVACCCCCVSASPHNTKKTSVLCEMRNAEKCNQTATEPPSVFCVRLSQSIVTGLLLARSYFGVMHECVTKHTHTRVRMLPKLNEEN